MESKAKIRINLNSRELEIEGTEEFINSHSAKIEEFLELLRKTPPPIPQPPVVVSNQQTTFTATPATDGNVPKTFGEYFHQLPKEAKDSDKMLIAGHFSQIVADDNSFKSGDAAKLLLEQGVQLSNPTVFLNQNKKPKYLIVLSRGKFRVSKEGVDYLKQLTSNTHTEK